MSHDQLPNAAIQSSPCGLCQCGGCNVHETRAWGQDTSRHLKGQKRMSPFDLELASALPTSCRDASLNGNVCFNGSPVIESPGTKEDRRQARASTSFSSRCFHLLSSLRPLHLSDNYESLFRQRQCPSLWGVFLPCHRPRSTIMISLALDFLVSPHCSIPWTL